jgi:hypothetical protein
MVDEALSRRVRELRGQGRSPKQISRALGMPHAEVARIVRAVAAEIAADAPEPELVGCWVNAGWTRGLTIEGEHDWPQDPEPEGGIGCEGLANVVVARRHRWDKISVCTYLVDVYCLGVKNTIGPRVMDEADVRKFIDFVYSSYAAPPMAVPLDLAQHLVFGAVAYARTLGFEPSDEFPRVRGHLGEWSGPSAIRFGRDGKPFFIQGPYDDAERIMRTLQRSAGRGNFHFTMVAAGSPFLE